MGQYVKIANIKGDRGAKGDTGTIASASVATVASDAPASVVMSGPEDHRHAHFNVPRGLPGVNAVPADEAVALYLTSAGSAARAALVAEFQSRLWISVKDFGAVGDGIADDTAAIQAAFDAADSTTIAGRDIKVHIPYGTYRVSVGLHLMSSLDAGEALINYYGTGTALTVGTTESHVTVSRRYIRLPRVVCMVNTAAAAWSATPVQGVRLANIYSSLVESQFIQNFDEGLICEGVGQGFAHNEVHPGSLWGNRRGLVIRHTDTESNIGWCNQNIFYAGRISGNSTWGVVDDPLAHYILFDTVGSGGPNANIFLGTSIEGPNREQYRVKVAGRYNYFINCRWEHASNQTVRVLFTSRAAANYIDGGYNYDRVVEVFEAGSAQNGFRMPIGVAEFHAYGLVSATSIPNSTPTAIATWNLVNGLKASYAAGTGRVTPRQGRWRITANITFKASANTAGIRALEIRKNGTTQLDIDRQAGSPQHQTLKVEATETFNGSTDYVDFVVQQSSGFALDLEHVGRFCKFTMEYVGA